MTLLILGVLALTSTIVLGQNLGSTCTDSGPFCIPQLSCKNGTCACDYTWQIYDAQLRKCVSPVGGFCKGDGSLRCTQNSKCSSKEQAFKDYLGFCICESPFVTVAGPSCDASSSKAGLTNVADPPPLLCCPGNNSNAQNKL